MEILLLILISASPCRWSNGGPLLECSDRRPIPTVAQWNGRVPMMPDNGYSGGKILANIFIASHMAMALA